VLATKYKDALSAGLFLWLQSRISRVNNSLSSHPGRGKRHRERLQVLVHTRTCVSVPEAQASDAAAGLNTYSYPPGIRCLALPRDLSVLLSIGRRYTAFPPSPLRVQTCTQRTNGNVRPGAENNPICFLVSRPVSAQDTTASHPACHIAPKTHYAA
jgi:hypothetical protein